MGGSENGRDGGRTGEKGAGRQTRERVEVKRWVDVQRRNET